MKLFTLLRALVCVLAISIVNADEKSNKDRVSFKAEDAAPTAKSRLQLYEDSHYTFMGHGYGNQGNDTPSFFAFSKAAMKWIRVAEISTENAVFGSSPDFNTVPLQVGWNHSSLKEQAYVRFPLITGAVLLPDKIEYDADQRVYRISIGSQYGADSRPTVFLLRKVELDARFARK